MRNSLRTFVANAKDDALAIATLVLVLLFFVGPSLLPGRVLMPLDIVTESWPPWQQPNQPVEVSNLLLSDVVNYIVPVKQWVAEQVRQGVLPLWNPFLLAGYPLTYNTQAGVFYPLMLLYYLLPVDAAVDATVIVQMLLGLLFMYGHLRSMRVGRPAAMIGTAIFMFNGLMIVWLEWQVVHAAIIWLPLQLYLVERIIRILASDSEPATHPLLINVVLAGISLGLPWLGGHWNWTLYASMTVAAYFLWRVVPIAARAGSWRTRRRIAFAVAAVFIIAVGLCLVQVLPAANYLADSHRQPFTLAESQERALLNRLVVLFVPNFFGNPVDQNWWGPRNFAETTLYPGILALLLAGLAPWLRRDTFGRFFAAWGGLGLLWSLGGPAYWVLYVVPGFSGLFPSRAAIIFVFCVSILAAFAVDKLMTGVLPRKLTRLTLLLLGFFLIISASYFVYYRSDVRETWSYLMPQAVTALLFLSAAGLVVLARRRGLRPALFGSLAFLLIVGELFWFGHRYNTISSHDGRLYPDTPVARFLSTRAGEFRILTPAEGIVFPPNSSMVERIENLSGYEPGIMQRTVDLMNIIEGGNAVRAFRVLMPLRALGSPILDVLNVKYFLSTHDFWLNEPIKDIERAQAEEWINVTPGTIVGQQFAMSDAGLHRIDLKLRPSGNSTGVVTVRVFTADGVLELAHSEVDATQIQPDDWHAFYFDPFPSEWGRRFTLTVEYRGEGGDIEIARSSADRYPRGEMTLDGSAVSGDLAFATYFVPRPELVFEDRKTRIYLNEGFFERAFAASGAVVAESAEEALTAVVAQADQLDRLVILELDGQPLPPDSQGGSSSPGTVAITDYQPNRVTLTADMAESGFVVLSDTYYPGWRAAVDGVRAPVYRANYLLRAVHVPAGRHTVEFTFLPLDFVVGGVVSLLSLLGSVSIILVAWRRMRKPGLRV